MRGFFWGGVYGKNPVIIGSFVVMVLLARGLRCVFVLSDQFVMKGELTTVKMMRRPTTWHMHA